MESNGGNNLLFRFIMKKNLLIYCILPVFTVFAGCSVFRPGAVKTAEEISLQEKNNNITEVGHLTGTFNKNDFSGKKLVSYSNKELDTLFESLSLSAFYFVENPQPVYLMESVFREKQRRNSATEYYVKEMFKAFLETYMFDKCYALKKEYPNVSLDYMPEKFISGPAEADKAWRIYNLSDGWNIASVEASGFDKGKKIIMVILPGCSAAETAIQKILDDPEWGPVFRKYGAILMGRMAFQYVDALRKYYKYNNVYLAYRESDFSKLDFRSSPNLYFLYDGEVKYNHIGFGEKKGASWKDEFIKGMVAIGVDKDDTVIPNKTAVNEKSAITEKTVPDKIKTSAVKTKNAADKTKSDTDGDFMLSLNDLLKDIPQEEHSEFLNSFVMKNGQIVSFNYSVFAKHFSEEKLKKTVNAIHAAGYQDKTKKKPAVNRYSKISELLSKVPEKVRDEFIESFVFKNAFLVSAYTEKLTKAIGEKKAEEILKTLATSSGEIREFSVGKSGPDTGDILLNSACKKQNGKLSCVAQQGSVCDSYCYSK